MENKCEEGLSPVLIKAREEYAKQQKKEPNSVIAFRNSLRDKNVRNAFNRMFNVDGSFTKEGKKDFERFKKFNFSVDGSQSYYVYGSTPTELYKFLCFYIIKEKKYRLIKRQRELKEQGKDPEKARGEIFNLMPVVTFVSTFVQEEVSPTQPDSTWGDSHGTILVFYIPNSTLYGNQMTFFASVVKNYIEMKKHVDEHVIILAETDFDEFTAASSLPIINLFTGKITLNDRPVAKEDNINRKDVGTTSIVTTSERSSKGELYF